MVCPQITVHFSIVKTDFVHISEQIRPWAIILLSSEQPEASEKVKLCKLLAKGRRDRGGDWKKEFPRFSGHFAARPWHVSSFLLLAFYRVSKEK